MRLTDALPIIKQSVSAVQAADALGLNPDRYGRCACPIHNGKDRNMKLFGGEKGFYCYVCHAGGDAADLVRQVHGCSLREAASWLDSTFGLGLDINRPTDEKRVQAVREAVKRRRREREQAERDRAATLETWHRTLTVTIQVDDEIERTRPRKYSEDFSDAFCAALAAREELRLINEELTDMVCENEEKRRA